MKDIQQLIKKNSQEGRYEDIFPKTFIDAVEDRESGNNLTEILSGFNMYFLSYNGSRELTRLQVPLSLRKTGLWITYVLYDKTVVTEWYAGEAIDDDSWKNLSNWRVGTNMLVGDISISSDGYWVVNGIVTTTKAQGEQGITPMLRVGSNNHLQASYTNGSSWVDVSTNPVYTQFRINNNKLEQSVDLGQTWTVVSDYIASWFKFTGTTGSSQANNVGKIQISRDNGATWSDLSGEFTNSLHIKGYVATIATLPSSAVQGDIYGVGPTYDPSDTEQTNPIYQLYVKDSTGWVNNGKFTSIAAGVVQTTGTSTTEVMSQDAVSKEFASVRSDLNQTKAEIRSDFNETRDAINALSNGSPAGVFDTLSDLNLAIPLGNDRTYVVLADGGWYYYSSGWQYGGQYQAALSVTDKLGGSETLVINQYGLGKVLVDVRAFYADGDTDDTNAINRALLYVHNNNNGGRVYIPFKLNKYIISSPIIMYSNTSLLLDDSATIYLANNSNCYMLTNANKSTLVNNIVDKNVSIEGGIWDGNPLNQIHTLDDGRWVVGFGLFGIENLTIKNLTIKAKTFAIHVSCLKNYTFKNIQINHDVGVGVTPLNQDGIHINGPAYNGLISNIKGSTWDDMVAVNADDGGTFGGVTAFGEIVDLIIDGVECNNSLNVIRVLSSSSLIDRILIKNIIGTCTDSIIEVSSYGMGDGNFGSIEIDSVNVLMLDPVIQKNAGIILNNKIDSISFKNIRFDNPTVLDRVLFSIYPDAEIKQLSISGLAIYQANNTLSQWAVIRNFGSIVRFNIDKVDLLRDDSLNKYCVFLDSKNSNAVIYNLHLSNSTFSRMWNLIAYSDVKPISTDVFITNVKCINSSNSNSTDATLFIKNSFINNLVINSFFDPEIGFKINRDNSYIGNTITDYEFLPIRKTNITAKIDTLFTVPSNSGWVKIPFITDTLDTLSEFSDNRFTAKTYGAYGVSFSINITGGSINTKKELAITNGEIQRVYTSKSDENGVCTISGFAVVELNKGRYIEILILSDSLDATIDTDKHVTFLCINKI